MSSCVAATSDSVPLEPILSSSMAQPQEDQLQQQEQQKPVDLDCKANAQTETTRKEQQQGQEQQEQEPDQSALHTNIRTKGQNSYYYAHKKRDDVEIHEWDGNAEPRLLKKEPLSPEKLQQKASTANALQQYVPITQYAWSDSKKKVTIYVTLEGIGTLQDDQVRLEWTPNHFALRITGYQNKNLLLNIPLANEISDAKIKRKQDQIVVFLQKYTEFTWHSLKKE